MPRFSYYDPAFDTLRYHILRAFWAIANTGLCPHCRTKLLRAAEEAFKAKLQISDSEENNPVLTDKPGSRIKEAWVEPISGKVGITTTTDRGEFDLEDAIALK